MSVTLAGRLLRDDGSVGNFERLYRRIHADWINPTTGSLLGTAFLDRRTGEVSVDRAGLTTRADVMRGFEWMGLADVEASVPRRHSHGVTPDPFPDHPAHAVIFPLDASQPGKRIKAEARQIAAAAVLLIKPS